MDQHRIVINTREQTCSFGFSLQCHPFKVLSTANKQNQEATKLALKLKSHLCEAQKAEVPANQLTEHSRLAYAAQVSRGRGGPASPAPWAAPRPQAPCSQGLPWRRRGHCADHQLYATRGMEFWLQIGMKPVFLLTPVTPNSPQLFLHRFR